MLKDREEIRWSEEHEKLKKEEKKQLDMLIQQDLIDRRALDA